MSPELFGLDCDDDGEVEFCGCQMDADGDGNIGPFDLAFLLGNWGPYGPGDDGRCIDANVPADVNIGPFDLAVLLGAWGPCPP